MTVTETDFTAQWREWQAAQEARISAPHGFLAITSLNFLTEEPQRFGDAPGEWTATDDRVTVVLADDEEITVGGQPRTGTYTFDAIPERGGVNVEWKDAVIEVAKRGGYHVVRPRHPDNALRVNFTGTPAYEPDPKWAVPAVFRRFDEPRPVTVGAAVEGLEHVYDAVGQLEFELEGQALSLTVFPGYEPGGLIVLFTDGTSGRTTYGAVRSIHLPPPADDDSVLLDFNRAGNLPCAYTALATCPLPPPGNRLTLDIEAGQKTPHEKP